MRRAGGHGDGGFSLVEALASLVIVSMIGLMLAAGMTTGRRVWEGQDKREAAGEILESAQDILRDRIEEIYPQTRYDTVPSSVDFQGGPETMVFLSNPSDARRPGPLRRYRLSLDTAGRLVLASISDVANADAAIAEEQVLLKGARKIELSYFGAAADGRRQWRGAWENQAALPELVRLRVEFPPQRST